MSPSMPSASSSAEPSSEELYEELMKERAAWKQAKRAAIEATLREAGSLVVGCGGGCGCGGCAEDAPSHAQPSPARTRREASNEDPWAAHVVPQEAPCFQTLFHFQLPDFHTVDLATQFCFALEFGAWEWPRTDCCPPMIRATTSCDPPSMAEYISASFQVDEHVLNRVNDRMMDDPNDPDDFTLMWC